MKIAIANSVKLLRVRMDLLRLEVCEGKAGEFIRAQFRCGKGTITELIIDPMQSDEGGTLRICNFKCGTVPDGIDARDLCERLSTILSVGHLTIFAQEDREIGYLGQQFFDGTCPPTGVLNRLIDEALLAARLWKAAMKIAAEAEGKKVGIKEMLPACPSVALN